MPELNIAYQVIVPVRKTAAESAEQVSQLLLGDVVQILDEDRNWRKVKVLADGYEGWVDRKLLFPVDQSWLDSIKAWHFVQAHSVRGVASLGGLEAAQPLTLGCRIPVDNAPDTDDRIQVKIGAWGLSLPANAVSPAKPFAVEHLLQLSELYIGTPYLWGGKSPWGIDCSGFTQMLFAMCSKQLPRDAYQQHDAPGDIIKFGEHQPGDLAFFSNDNGKVIHVGMVIPGGKIRHASGFVHDAWLRPEGIFNPITQLQTHKLCRIKRFH